MFVFFMGTVMTSQSQFIVQNKQQTDKIKFKLINNLVVIPLEINGVSLTFLLDTGVSKPILFNFLNISDSLNIKNTETIYLRGLGEGESIEALKSINNVLKIGDAINLNQDLYCIYNDKLNFSPKLGITVHGIIGYDVFKDLIVEINYSKKLLRLTNPESFEYKTCKQCEQLNLEFYNNKPYINAEVVTGGRQVPVKLLIDSGGSDALWLFENDTLGIKSRDKFFYDFLGHGLSGSVYGKRTKIEALKLKSFELKQANVAYPDSSSISIATKFKGRNGSLAGNILKRFNIIYDYRNALLTLKKNSNFKEAFRYNKSGIELEHGGVRLVREVENKLPDARMGAVENSENVNSTRVILDTQYKLTLKPAYAVVELRRDSPAHKAGLKIGDIIIAVNGKGAHNFTLQELMYKFYEDEGKRIKLKVDRDGQYKFFSFYLENPI